MKKTFLVTVTASDDVRINDLKRYIREAISVWGGQLHPDDPLFEHKKVTVKSPSACLCPDCMRFIGEKK